jgi:hypothetical protein
LTDIKCNLKQHIVRKHSLKNSDKNDEQNVAQKSENCNQICENPNQNKQNCNFLCENSNHQMTPFQCEKCQKVLSNKRNLQYHINICKGIINGLECYICHKVFNSYSSKNKHLKTCLSQSLIIAPENQPSQVTNNNTTNIGRDQNINNNNISQTNNITIITVDPNKLENLEFITSHITNPQLKNMLKLTHRDENDSKKVNMLETFVRELMTNPANKCIQKSNMQNVYSQIHTGDNKWITKHDKDLYPKLTCNVANGFSDLMSLRNEEEQMIKTDRKLKELQAFLDYMADEGFRNDADEQVNHQTHLMYKELVQRIKSVVFDFTKVSI